MMMRHPSSLLEKVFRKNGYEPTVAADGREALDLFAAQDFEIAFVDIGLPDMSGMDVLKQVSGEFPDTSVIMATSLVDVGAAGKL